MATASVKNIRVVVRRDTADNWTKFNPVLLIGEQGYETDLGNLKFGDGKTPWRDLPYFVGNPEAVIGTIDGGSPAGYGKQL